MTGEMIVGNEVMRRLCEEKMRKICNGEGKASIIYDLVMWSVRKLIRGSEFGVLPGEDKEMGT
jgi:hypothetical protein